MSIPIRAITPSGRILGPHDIENTSLFAWDWFDLSLYFQQQFIDRRTVADFWGVHQDQLTHVVLGQTGAVRGEVAEVAQQLLDMELRLGAAIAGGAGVELTALVNEVNAFRFEFTAFHNAVVESLFTTEFHLAQAVGQVAPAINAGLSRAAREVGVPLRDAAATFIANLFPLVDGLTKDFVGDRAALLAALARVEAGQGGAWTAALPLVLRSLVYALKTGGPIVALSLGKEVLEHFPALRGVLGTIGAELGQGLVAGIETLHGPMRATMGGLATLFFNELERDLAGLGEATEGNVLQIAAQLLGTAGSLGASAHLAALAAENIAPLKHMGFGQFGAFLVDLAGFESIARNSIGIQMETAIREPARRRANRIHRPSLPDKATMEQLFLERRAAPEELADFYRTQGWPEHFIQRWLETLFVEATPRDLAIVFEDVDVDPLWAQDHLRQRGFTDEDAFRITEGLRTRAVKSQRGQAVGALVGNYTDGLLDESALIGALRELRFSDEALRLILLSAQQKRLNQEAEQRRRLIEDAAAIGAFTVEDVGASLAAFGYDARAQQLAMSRARLRRGVQVFREETAELKQAVRRAQADSITAGLELFRRFRLDPGGLAAWLREAGVNAEEVEALVILAGTRREPVPRLPTVLTPEAEIQEATRLEADRILDLTRKGLLTEAAAVSSLRALGVDARVAAAEAALAAARLRRPGEVPRPPTPEEILDQSQRARADAAVARFREGLLSAAGLGAALRAAGMAAEVAAAFVEREVARAEAERVRESRDLVERELRDQRAVLESAAVAAFRAGRLDEGGLLQNLLALGISRVTAQAIVDRELAVKQGRPAPTRS